MCCRRTLKIAEDSGDADVVLSHLLGQLGGGPVADGAHARGQHPRILNHLHVQQRKPARPPHQSAAVRLIAGALLVDAFEAHPPEWRLKIGLKILNLLQANNIGLDASDAVDNFRHSLVAVQSLRLAAAIEVWIILHERVAKHIPAREAQRWRPNRSGGSLGHAKKSLCKSLRI